MATPNRIRVLWLVKGLGPGGAEQLLLLSAKVADHERFDYRLRYVRPDKTHLVPEFESVGVYPKRLGGNVSGVSTSSQSEQAQPTAKRWAQAARAALSRITGSLKWLSDLRREMSAVDVVHPHSPVLAAAARVLSLTIPKRRRPAIVVTEHNEWTSHHKLTRLANALTAPVDARRWAVSDQVLQTMWPSRRKRTEVLIHGIDTSTPPPEAGTRERVREALGIAENEVLALTVGNLRRNKDYPNLLAAANRARADFPRLRFIAVGQGPLEQEIKSLHRDLGLGDGFQLLGFRRDVADLMAASDIFVMGSAHEGLPVAIMEAFAAGLPVVATTVGGVPQQVREEVEGMLVPPGNPEALASALVKVAGDGDMRTKMASAAGERAAAYDIRAAMGEQEQTYQELVQR